MSLDTLLEHTGAVAGPSDAVLASGASRLAAAIVASRDERAVRRSRRTRLRLLAAVTAAAAAGVVAVPILSVNDAAPSSRAEAATVLRLAAQAAGEQDGGWPNAKYWHTVSHYTRNNGPSVRRQIWIGHWTRGVLDDPGAGGGLRPLAPGGEFVADTYRNWDGLYALPTDTAELESLLRHGHPAGQGRNDAQLVDTIAGLLRESPAPPALRRALYEIVANIQNIEFDGSVRDADGRPGASIRVEDMQLIIDTSDGRLLQQGDGDGAWVATYEEQGPSDTAPAPNRTS
jgi:hypothetical protein